MSSLAAAGSSPPPTADVLPRTRRWPSTRPKTDTYSDDRRAVQKSRRHRTLNILRLSACGRHRRMECRSAFRAPLSTAEPCGYPPRLVARLARERERSGSQRGWQRAIRLEARLATDQTRGRWLSSPAGAGPWALLLAGCGPSGAWPAGVRVAELPRRVAVDVVQQLVGSRSNCSLSSSILRRLWFWCTRCRVPRRRCSRRCRW